MRYDMKWYVDYDGKHVLAAVPRKTREPIQEHQAYDPWDDDCYNQDIHKKQKQ